MLFNYHTHTKRCKHASGEDREYVEKAIQGGLKTLGFSDHAPYLMPEGHFRSAHRMDNEEIFEYAESVRALAKEYEKDIRILCGFELEYYPEFHAEEMAFLRQVAPDYLILGQHYLGDEDPTFTNTKEDAMILAYATQVISALETGDFLYLAHPDMRGWHCSFEACEREYRRICKYAKKKNIPLELNLLGLATNRWYPSKEFFQIAAEEGNDIILGVDAHWPTAFVEKEAEEKALEMVKTLGLKLIDKPIL